MKHFMRMKSITRWTEAWEIMRRRLFARLTIIIAIFDLTAIRATAQADQLSLQLVDGKAVPLANHRGQSIK